jgi:hypothetical protein
MGRATEYRGIPQLLKRSPPSAENLWTLAARLLAIKAILIKADITTEEEFTRLEKGYLRGITKKRTEKIRETTFNKEKTS